MILGLFLEYRLAFWVMMGMSISFVGGIVFLPMLGISINMISMFGFLVVLGIVVDDAIVVGENIYEYRQKGMSYLDAAIAGARDIATPVIFQYSHYHNRLCAVAFYSRIYRQILVAVAGGGNCGAGCFPF
ncbi:MAG: efflux RND transporter permease subunit [Owenweeksia sp.]|nr:efflux RND transporter permease subunit [Owenweeksia sp.]